MTDCSQPMAACERADGAPKEKAAGLAALAPGSDGALLFEMRFLHPLIHAGAALLSFACGTTSFALASLLYALFTSALFNNKDLLSYDDLASSALPLRTISFLINALTIALVLKSKINPLWMIAAGALIGVVGLV